METNTTSSSKTFLFLSSLIFWLLFSILFLLFKESNINTFDTMVTSLPIYDYIISSANQTKDILSKYWIYIWWVFIILYLIITLLLLFFAKIFRIYKYRLTAPIVMLVVNILFFILWFWLVNYEPRLIAISIWIIVFVWKTLLYTSSIMLFVSFVYLLKNIFHKVPQLPSNVIMIFMLLFLWWCVEGCGIIWYVLDSWCDLSEDSDHCYQQAAVSENNPEICDKIEYGPPRDKCHMMIAMNSMDTSYCNEAEWNPLWYSSDFCEWQVLDVVLEEWEDETQKEKNEEFRNNKDKIFEEIEDGDVKVEIARQFNDYRKDNQDKSAEEWTKKLEDIAVDVETMKRLDDNANQLLDNLKSSMVWYVNSKTDEAKDQVLSEWWDMVKAKANTLELEERIKNLESIKAWYDKVSDTYNFINEKLESIKKVKEEIESIYKRIDAVDNMLRSDKIDAWQARVLKWAILLDEWLKNVTWYVPVFWSTISTISDETFNVVIKFASSRASRTHALNKCIESPETCDPNGISAY